MISKEENNILSAHLENNNNASIDDLVMTLNLLQMKGIQKNSDLNSYVSSKRENNLEENEKETFNRLILENKFYDITWEIILEDSSSISNDISLVKILVKLIYLNLPSLEKKELNLVMDEKSFEEFYEEISKVYKNF